MWGEVRSWLARDSIRLRTLLSLSSQVDNYGIKQSRPGTSINEPQHSLTQNATHTPASHNKELSTHSRGRNNYTKHNADTGHKLNIGGFLVHILLL